MLFALAGIGVVFALVIAAWKFSDPGQQQIPGLPDTASTPKRAVHTRARAALPRFHLYVKASHGNSWMDVRSGSINGHSRYTGTLELGQPGLPFSARKLWIRFGNPGNLSIVLNGKLVGTVTRSGSYIVTRSGITRAA